MIFIFLLLIIFFLLVYIFYLRFCEKRHRVNGEKYLTQMERTEEHALSLEKLISFLLEVQELGISVTPLESGSKIYEKILDYACRLVDSNKGTLMLCRHSLGQLMLRMLTPGNMLTVHEDMPMQSLGGDEFTRNYGE